MRKNRIEGRRPIVTVADIAQAVVEPKTGGRKENPFISVTGLLGLDLVTADTINGCSGPLS